MSELQTFDTGAVRDTESGKSRPDLISPVILDRLGEHLRKGAEKYGPWNWTKGIPNSRCFTSLMRHVMQAQAELLGLTPTTGEDHLAAIIFNAGAIMHNQFCVTASLLPESLDDMRLYDNVQTYHGFPFVKVKNLGPPSKRLIYVAGPLSNGGKATEDEKRMNTNTAVYFARELGKKGYLPHIPHAATGPLDYCAGMEYEDFMELDFTIVDVCSAGFRVPGESPGADREIERLLAQGKPVYYNLDDVPIIARGNNDF